jgi:hypothetical protein
VRRAGVVRRRACIEIKADDASAGVDLDTEVGRAAEDRALLLARPQRLGQRRSRVRLVLLSGEHPDRARLVVVADPAARRVAGHASADDQVPVRRHRAAIVSASVGCAR